MRSLVNYGSDCQSQFSNFDRITKSLYSSEEGFRSIAENSDHAILISYGIDTTFVYTNRFATELTGYSSNELLNLRPSQLVDAEGIPTTIKHIRWSLQGKHSPKRHTTTLARQNGQLLPIEVFATQVMWDGKPAIMSQFRDISFYKHLEAQLEKANLELERRLQERTSEMIKATEELEEKREELLRHKRDLELSNSELVQTNVALSVLARNIDRSHDEFEKKIADIVSLRIMPVIEEFRQDRISAKSLAALDVIATYLSELTSGSVNGREVIVSLSPMEMRIAVMIKKEFSSNQIARLLNLSLDTVKTHRRSIRRKLGLCNSSVNLSSYLKLKTDEQFPPPHAST
jgi:PAS domain S-box-containing protein